LYRPLGTSFKGKYGCVDYWVKAFLDRPSQPTQETKKNFEVMDLVDVNTPDLMVRFILRFCSPWSQDNRLDVLSLDRNISQRSFFPFLHRHQCLLKRRRKFPACSFLMGGCLFLLELKEKDSVKVKSYAQNARQITGNVAGGG
jgi:hypothetical protein